MSFLLSTRAVTESSHVSVIQMDEQAQAVSAQVRTGVRVPAGWFNDTVPSTNVVFGPQSIGMLHASIADLLLQLERDPADTSLADLIRFVTDRAIDEQTG